MSKLDFLGKLQIASRGTIEDNIGPEQYIQLLSDLEKGDNDEYWLTKYPMYIHEIFAILIHLNVNLTSSRVEYFVSKGLNVNAKVTFIDDDDNPSHYILKAIENRNHNTAHALTYCLADLTVKDTNGYNALELALLGKDITDRENVFSCEHLVYMIGQFVSVEDEFTISQWIVDDCCQKYIAESKHLSDVIRLCSSSS